MTETDSQPIAENEQVKELLALLKDNNTPGYEEFSKLIEHVTGMEQRLLEATEELKAVRQEMQGLQNHSLKDALQKSYNSVRGGQQGCLRFGTLCLEEAKRAVTEVTARFFAAAGNPSAYLGEMARFQQIQFSRQHHRCKSSMDF